MVWQGLRFASPVFILLFFLTNWNQFYTEQLKSPQFLLGQSWWMGSSGLVKGLVLLFSLPPWQSWEEIIFFHSGAREGRSVWLVVGQALGQLPWVISTSRKEISFHPKASDTNIYTGLRDDRLTARVVHGHFEPDPPLPLPACNPNKHNCTWWPFPTVDWSRMGHSSSSFYPNYPLPLSCLFETGLGI